jgi:hypothetical protein
MLSWSSRLFQQWVLIEERWWKEIKWKIQLHNKRKDIANAQLPNNHKLRRVWHTMVKISIGPFFAIQHSHSYTSKNLRLWLLQPRTDNWLSQFGCFGVFLAWSPPKTIRGRLWFLTCLLSDALGTINGATRPETPLAKSSCYLGHLVLWNSIELLSS